MVYALAYIGVTTGATAAAAAAAQQEAEACLPGPLIRVAPDVFIDLEPEMELIVHGQFGVLNRHIYLGTFYDQVVMYCIVSEPIDVHVDLEAKSIRKYVQL